ncbi:MAG: PH domain-containing protein [Myxococcaceae bacterium]|nr:PH domain-containing protein [Myxococcaceae bacterium]
MGLAGAIWVFVFLYLLTFDGVPARTVLSAAFFVVFFALALTYYGRSAIWVDQSGLTFRGMVRTRRLTWAEIRKLDVLPGPVTVYAIRARGMPCHFTSFFRHHKRLANLLIERAGLASAR